jgi:phosphoribosylformylglycinamidine synthase
MVASAHDVSEGGVLTSLTESAMAGSLGYNISLPAGVRKDIFLFSESQGRIIITVSKENLTKAEELLAKQAIPLIRFGAVNDWKTQYQNALFNILEQ